MLLDSHHHFDFLTGPPLRAAFLRALCERDVRIVAQTLTPSAFAKLVDDAEGLGVDEGCLPLWSLGLHPWHLGGEAEAERAVGCFAEQVHRTRFIGEIGLDFSPRRLQHSPAPVQRNTLRQLLHHVCEAATSCHPGRPMVLSLHAVRSAGELLDLLDEVDVAGHGIVPVFHRFSGTSQELTRLVRMGGHLSVHPHLLSTKRGRAYVRQVPADRLLLESDLPEGPLTRSASDVAAAARRCADELADVLHGSLRMLSQLRQCDMAHELAQTQARLYGPLEPPRS
ncbi:TatD family hydrolase [Luteococcus sp. OSA5]|uniref:TatD family hydrolase n=1 Tax=Luteococcus sp. OSA5 TaxID=3401630 RepID=UPI003B42CA91